MRKLLPSVPTHTASAAKLDRAPPAAPAEPKHLAPKEPCHSIPRALPVVPRSRFASYRKALGDRSRVESALATTKEATLALYRTEGSGLRFAELTGSPMTIARSIEITLECDPDDRCVSKLSGYDLGLGRVAFVATVSGTGSRGQGTFTTNEGQLWTLGSGGFTLAAKLPSASSSVTAHGVVDQTTSFYWVDADGKEPCDVLVLHRDSSAGTLMGAQMLPGWDRRERLLFVFDTDRVAYVNFDVSAETPAKTLERLTRGSGFTAF